MRGLDGNERWRHVEVKLEAWLAKWSLDQIWVNHKFGRNCRCVDCSHGEEFCGAFSNQKWAESVWLKIVRWKSWIANWNTAYYLKICFSRSFSGHHCRKKSEDEGYARMWKWCLSREPCGLDHAYLWIDPGANINVAFCLKIKVVVPLLTFFVSPYETYLASIESMLNDHPHATIACKQETGPHET